MIRKEAWSFYRTISGVRLCWKLEEPKGPEGSCKQTLLGLVNHLGITSANQSTALSTPFPGKRESSRFTTASRRRTPGASRSAAVKFPDMVGWARLGGEKTGPHRGERTGPPRDKKAGLAPRSQYSIGPPRDRTERARLGTHVRGCRGTSLMRKRLPLGAYSRHMPRVGTRGMRRRGASSFFRFRAKRDSGHDLCKVSPVILHGMVSPETL